MDKRRDGSRARMMTRRDFQALARAIADMDLPAQEKRYVADCIARACKERNAGFKVNDFHKACGTEAVPNAEHMFR